MQRSYPPHGEPQGDPLDLNLRSLDIFLQIAESGGMSSTARRMGLTQSAVSQIIANLEQSLGVKLFDRHVRPIALTPSGVLLREKARDILITAREAIRAVREPSSPAFARLHIALADTVAGTIGPQFVRAIQGFASELSIHAGLCFQHKKALLAREADIVISPDPLDEEARIERYEILREPFLFALPAGHASAPASLAALAQELDLVRFSTRSLLGRQVERHLSRLRVNARGRLEFDTADAVLAMVAGNVGWTLLTPLCALVGGAYWPRVKFAPMPEPLLFRRIYLVARQGEFGELPRKIAHICSVTFGRLFDEKLTGPYSWMKDAIWLPPAARGLAQEGRAFVPAVA